MKKVLSMLLALVMILGTAVPVFAAEDVEDPAKDNPVAKEEVTEKVTLHKLLLEKEVFDKWKVDGPEGYDGTQDLEAFKKLPGAESAKEIKGVYFAVQDKDGNWVKADGTTTTDVKEALGGLTTETGLVLDTSKLPQDKPTDYKIVEVRELSTYVGEDGKTLSEMKAVPVEITLPLVNENGVQKEVHVYPKNTETGKPENKKEMADTASEDMKAGKVTIGDTVPYKVTTTVKAGSTYNKLAWTDKMSKGLTFSENVEISTNPELGLEKDTDYTLTNGDNGFVLVLTDAGLTKLAQKTAPANAGFKVNGKGEPINGENTDVTFTLTYSAVVNSEAAINNPLENTNTLHYGNNPGYTPEPGDNNPPPVTPKDRKITVDKSFTNGPTAKDSAVAWPDGLEITLKLQVYNPADNTWSDVEGQTKTLNSGATSATFEGLDNAKQYKVVEVETKGWVPNYSTTEDGKVVIVNKKNDNPPPITPDPVVVRTGGKKFVKTNQDGTERLEGAEFIILNESGDKYLKSKDKAVVDENQEALVKAETEYQNAVKKPESAEKIAELKAARDAAAKDAAIVWEWTETEDDAQKFVTNDQGQWGVYGLAYGEYKYKEITPPADYAKNETPVAFTVSDTSFNADGDIDFIDADNNAETNTVKDATKITNKKVTIPQTGGIGTIIFGALGIALMAGAVVAMKRREVAEE